MRIRSIRPEFWTSEDVAAMPWDVRLVFIGLWSYVDDNGVGRDVEQLIVAALFPLDPDFSEASLRTHGALKYLETHQNITRFEVNGKRYLYVNAFNKHQRINRPSDGRYPLPTTANAADDASFSEPSLSPHANAPLGEGEKGRRGEGVKGEKRTRAPRAAALDADFDAWWQHYPRKVSKKQAQAAYKTARKKVGGEVLLDAVQNFAGACARSQTDPKFIAHAATWLNGERWNDVEPQPAKRHEMWEGAFS